MIDIRAEEMVTITGATKKVPSRPHVSTLWRWINRGCRGVKLETVLIGGVRFTSCEALQRFVEQVTAAAAGKPLPKQTSRQRKRAEAEADRILDEAGV